MPHSLQDRIAQFATMSGGNAKTSGSMPKGAEMPPAEDRRLYLPHPENWVVKAKQSYDREYCHAKFPGDDHYHLLVGGELHLDNGEQKYCLDCAMRLEIITVDRMYWQKGRASDVAPPADETKGGPA